MIKHLALLLLSLPLMAATYYVSNAGSDGANGTTTGTAWQTLAHVNAQTFQPGDSVLLQTGGIWRETLIPPSSGSTGNPIKFGAYGTSTQPIIDGANLTTWTNSSGNVWYASESGDPVLPFSGLTPFAEVNSIGAIVSPYQYYFDGAALRVYVYSVGNPASTVEIPTRNAAVSLSNRSFLSFTGIDIRGATGNGGFNATTNNQHISITGCTVDLNVQDGVWFYDPSTSQDYGIVTGNIVRNNGSSGIDLNSDLHSYWTISNNTVYQNGIIGVGISTDYTAGIKLFTYSGLGGTGSIVSNNYVYNNGGPGATTANGVGIWLDSDTGVSVTGNVSSGNSSSGIFLEKSTQCSATYNLVLNNCNAGLQYCANFSLYGSGTSGGGADAAYISQNNLVASNTIYSGGNAWWGLQTGVYTGFGLAISRNNTVRDNIVLGSSHEVAFFDAGGNNNGTNGSGNVYLNNTFGTAAANFINWVGTGDVSTYAAWEAAYCVSTGCSNSLQTTPSFTNTNALDLRPIRGSAALTASSVGGIIGALPEVGPSFLTGPTSTAGVVTVK